MISDIALWLAHTIGKFGYTGIVLLMFLESSFFPFPSEVVITPAGYLAATGEMNLSVVILAGVMGSLLGALFNYWISASFGRAFLERCGRYFLISEKTLLKADIFFANAAIWVSVLAVVGYWVGNNQALVAAYLHRLSIALAALSGLLVLLYIWKIRLRKRRAD